MRSATPPGAGRGRPPVRRIFRTLRGKRAARASETAQVQARMQATVEMHEFGVQAYRQRMRREHPQASPAEIEAMVRAWLREPPPEDRLQLRSKKENHDDTC